MWIRVENLPFSSRIGYVWLCNKPFPDVTVSNNYHHCFQGAGVQEGSAGLTASGSTNWLSSDSSWSWDSGRLASRGLYWYPYFSISSLRVSSLVWPRRLAWPSLQNGHFQVVELTTQRLRASVWTLQRTQVKTSWLWWHRLRSPIVSFLSNSIGWPGTKVGPGSRGVVSDRSIKWFADVF